MQLLPSDERFLQRALDLARNAAAFASPNPTVGCVLERDGAIIGEGAHFYDDRDHAEIAALKQAASSSNSAHGATAFVTLEPCAHHGRTGPCAIALVEAGVKRCVVATLDPNPLVSGLGFRILRDGGIATEVVDSTAQLAVDARRLNDSFAFSIANGRPFITLKAAISVDGYLAPAPESRSDQRPVWLTGEGARADVQELRHANDAILTGVGTILADNPALTDRTGSPRRRPLLRAVLDSRLRTPPRSNLIESGLHNVIILTTASAPETAAAALETRGAEVIRLPDSAGRVDLPSVLQVLHQREVRSLLVEAGSSVNAAFLSADLVDRVVLYYSDTELGRGSIPFARSAQTAYALQQSLRSITRKSFTHAPQSRREDVRVSGYVHDPWKGTP